MSVKLRSLPADMLVLLADLFEDAGCNAVPGVLPTRVVRVGALPMAPVGVTPGDARGHAHVAAMLDSDLPPLIVCDGWLIDGKHRAQALRLKCEDTVTCIDLSGLIPAPQVPRVGLLRE